METKRCTYCHKLQRAETRVCSRCGRSFERRRSRSGKASPSSVSLFSLPPASPHHAGHYSGLHPEDQPYQSNKIVTPRRVPKDSKEKGTLPQEPGHILLPATQNAPVMRMYRDSSQVSTRRQIPVRRSHRQLQQEETLAGSQETQKMLRQARRNPQVPRPFAQDVDYDLASQLDETQRPLRVAARLASKEVIPETYRQEFELAETYRSQRNEYAEIADDEFFTQFSPAKDAVLLHDKLPAYMQRPPYARPRYSRIMSTVLVVAGFFSLLATSIIVLVLMGNHPLILYAQLKITPQILGVHDTFSLEGNGFTPDRTVTFTIDTNTAITGGNGQPLQAITDSRGYFSVHCAVPLTWSAGSHIIYAMDQASGQRFSANIMVQATLPTPPHLRLSTNKDSFGSSASGVVSSQTITLENTGGGTVVWQESSDQLWLTTSPGSGTFTGSQNIQINVNRGNMVPGDYTGLVTIKQQGQENTSSVHVTMTVGQTPAQMSVSVATFSYSTAQGQAPNGQILTIGNTGEQSLHWDATVSTEDGASWLTLSLYHGVLPSGVSQSLNVQVASQSLAVGTYTGLISFTGNADAQVEVSLNVVAPGNLVISPPSLTFGVAATQQTSQTLSLQNSGGSSLDWSVTPSTTDRGNWLSVTYASGTLAPGESATISVHVDATNLSSGSYQGTLTFSSGDQTKQLLISFVVTGTTPTPVSPTATSTPTATALPVGTS